MTELASQFLLELEPERTANVDGEALEARLAEIIREASERWPQLAVDEALFARYLAQRSEGNPPELPRHPTDLYLACACLAGDRRALGELDAICSAQARAAVQHMRLSADVVDEVVQRTRIRVLVGDELRLIDYRGTGELRGWLRAVAIREALGVLRTHKRDAARTTDFDDDDLLVSDDAILASLKQRYRAVFRPAFEQSLARLAPADRTLLRQIVLDRVTIEQVAVLHGVHRVTASRWLQRIRSELLKETRREVSARLGGATRAELDRVFELINSQLEASVERLLRER